MKDIKVNGITIRLQHKEHEHKIDFVKNHDTGKYEVWIDANSLDLREYSQS